MYDVVSDGSWPSETFFNERKHGFIVKASMAKYFLALLMLLAAASGFARGAPEAETFLWQLSQPGRPVSYLLGTLHVGKTGARLPAHYQRALEQSAQLVVESNADELAEPQYAAEAARMAALMADTRTLDQSIGRVRMFALNHVLQQGNDTIALDGSSRLKPWAFWLSVQSLYSPKGYSYHSGTDNLLIRQAKAQQKPVIALERLEPLYYFNAVPEDKIRRSLDMLIRHHRTILAEQKTLVADYQANQARRLWQDVSDPEEQFKYLPVQDRAFWQHLMYQQLLVERNQQWLVRLVEILPQQPTLVAVGAAHLFGEQGLILRLRQVGYRVEPVLPE